MVEIKEIINSFKETKASLENQTDYPNNPGIYCFFLKDNAHLGDFIGEKIIYVGIAKDSLKTRDFSQHFKTGRTGSSTLRRSIGAILKEQLNLRAMPRGKPNTANRINNYNFNAPEDESLTTWMTKNLLIGYWEDYNNLSYSELRKLEKQVTILLKPILDLDRRTVKYNSFAEKLLCLREICKKEACEYIKTNE